MELPAQATEADWMRKTAAEPKRQNEGGIRGKEEPDRAIGAE